MGLFATGHFREHFRRDQSEASYEADRLLKFIKTLKRSNEQATMHARGLVLDKLQRQCDLEEWALVQEWIHKSDETYRRVVQQSGGKKGSADDLQMIKHGIELEKQMIKHGIELEVKLVSDDNLADMHKIESFVDAEVATLIFSPTIIANGNQVFSKEQCSSTPLIGST